MNTVNQVLKPDTCGCSIVFSYDSDADLESVSSTYQMVNILKCARHEGMSDQDAYHSSWHVDNVNKNNAERFLLTQLPDHTAVEESDQGDLVTTWKPGVRFVFSFDDQNKLNVQVLGGPALDPATVQQMVDNHLLEG